MAISSLLGKGAFDNFDWIALTPTMILTRKVFWDAARYEKDIHLDNMAYQDGKGVNKDFERAYKQRWKNLKNLPGSKVHFHFLFLPGSTLPGGRPYPSSSTLKTFAHLPYGYPYPNVQR